MPAIQNENVATQEPVKETVPAPAKPKLTHKEKLLQKMTQLQQSIVADTEKFNTLKAEYDVIEALNSVAVGTAVSIKIGRAETTRVVDGVVIAVKIEEDGSAKYKVQYGEGFDADIAVVNASGFVSVMPSELPVIA